MASRENDWIEVSNKSPARKNRSDQTVHGTHGHGHTTQHSRENDLIEFNNKGPARKNRSDKQWPELDQTVHGTRGHGHTQYLHSVPLGSKIHRSNFSKISQIDAVPKVSQQKITNRTKDIPREALGNLHKATSNRESMECNRSRNNEYNFEHVRKTIPRTRNNEHLRTNQDNWRKENNQRNSNNNNDVIYNSPNRTKSERGRGVNNREHVDLNIERGTTKNIETDNKFDRMKLETTTPKQNNSVEKRTPGLINYVPKTQTKKNNKKKSQTQQYLKSVKDQSINLIDVMENSLIKKTTSTVGSAPTKTVAVNAIQTRAAKFKEENLQPRNILDSTAPIIKRGKEKKKIKKPTKLKRLVLEERRIRKLQHALRNNSNNIDNIDNNNDDAEDADVNGNDINATTTAPLPPPPPPPPPPTTTTTPPPPPTTTTTPPTTTTTNNNNVNNENLHCTDISELDDSIDTSNIYLKSLPRIEITLYEDIEHNNIIMNSRLDKISNLDAAIEQTINKTNNSNPLQNKGLANSDENLTKDRLDNKIISNTNFPIGLHDNDNNNNNNNNFHKNNMVSCPEINHENNENSTSLLPIESNGEVKSKPEKEIVLNNQFELELPTFKVTRIGAQLPDLHNRKFRDYCYQFPDKHVDELTTKLLYELMKLQARQHDYNKIKSRGKKRLVFGFNEVNKHLKVGHIKCVVIARDLEKSRAVGGLEHQISLVCAQCHLQDLQVIFALKKSSLGFSVCKAGTIVSIVGVMNFEGRQEIYKELISEVKIKEKEYFDKVWELRKAKLTKTEEINTSEVENISQNKTEKEININDDQIINNSFSSQENNPKIPSIQRSSNSANIPSKPRIETNNYLQQNEDNHQHSQDNYFRENNQKLSSSAVPYTPIQQLWYPPNQVQIPEFQYPYYPPYGYSANSYPQYYYYLPSNTMSYFSYDQFT